MNALFDALALAGAGAITYGAYEVHPPAGAIVGGLMMLTAGLVGGYTATRRRRGT